MHAMPPRKAKPVQTWMQVRAKQVCYVVVFDALFLHMEKKDLDYREPRSQLGESIERPWGPWMVEAPGASPRPASHWSRSPVSAMLPPLESVALAEEVPVE